MCEYEAATANGRYIVGPAGQGERGKDGSKPRGLNDPARTGWEGMERGEKAVS